MMRRPSIIVALTLAAIAPALAHHAWGQSSGSAPSGVAAVPQSSPPPPVTIDPAPSTVPPTPTEPDASTRMLRSTDLPPLPPPPGQVPGPVTSAPASVGQPGSAAPRGTSPAIALPQSGPRKPIDPAALDLVRAFQAGRDRDPTFRAAQAEYRANRIAADQSIGGYLPSASYSFQNIPTEAGSRQVVTVTQPIFSLSGYALLRQRDPRRRYANATLQVREQDLAVRTVTAIADIIRANEASTFNDAKIEALRTQSERAERLYRNGLGTVTDARDIQVRYQQAQASQLLLRSDQLAAAARLGSIIGEEVKPEQFRLSDQFGKIELDPFAVYVQQQDVQNPQIAAARETERINRFEGLRSWGSLLPVVGASATYSSRSGVQNSFVGLSVNVPLNAGSIFQIGSAKATQRRSLEERRAIEARARVELQRLYALVDGGQQALVISGKAIESAELSVYSNTQSYEGGVRTNVDVVNSIQTLFEVKSQEVTAATELAVHYLNMLLLAGVDTDDAVAETQRFLLNK